MFKVIFSIVFVSMTTIFIPVYGQVPSHTDRQSSKLSFDTTKTAILELRQHQEWVFDSTYKPAQLTRNDLSLIDSFLIRAVNDFNNWQERNNSAHPWMIDLRKYDYRKQIIAVSNNKGEKEVWVNCFCNSFDTSWKSEIIFVQDGATCYFNFKINLTTKRYSDFRVNSAG